MGAENTVFWVPIDEGVPSDDRFVLLSFSNSPVLTIGRYRVDEDGDGNFYDGDNEKSLSSYGILVNAWAELPPKYED